MATARSAMTGAGQEVSAEPDKAESILHTIDESTKNSARISLFHILTLGSIGASVALYLAGKRSAGIFVGLWPPTFQALKSVIDTNAKQGSD